MHNSKDNSSKMKPNKNTCLPEWTGIPENIQQYILDFLSPSIVLKRMITLSKTNLNLCGKYIIHRLQKEKFKYKSIYTGFNHTLALMTNSSLYVWGKNDIGQFGLGHNQHQYTPQKIEGRLERAFRLGHENLKSLSMFGNKSSEERRVLKNRFLSQHVLNGEINEVPTQRISPGRQA